VHVLAEPVCFEKSDIKLGVWFGFNFMSFSIHDPITELHPAASYGERIQIYFVQKKRFNDGIQSQWQKNEMCVWGLDGIIPTGKSGSSWR
jgi:hypothetical protein